jgi:N-methylhydantoinase A
MISVSKNEWFSKTRNAIHQLHTQATEEFTLERWPRKVEFLDRLDLRYVGQGYEISVPFSRESLKTFRAEHQRLYGFAYDKPVEVVNVRVTARIRTPQPKWRLDQPQGKAQPEKVRVRYGGREFPAACLDRTGVRTLRGPALVTEYSATTFLPPGWTARADPRGNLLLKK